MWCCSPVCRKKRERERKNFLRIWRKKNSVTIAFCGRGWCSKKDKWCLFFHISLRRISPSSSASRRSINISAAYSLSSDSIMFRRTELRHPYPLHASQQKHTYHYFSPLNRRLLTISQRWCFIILSDFWGRLSATPSDKSAHKNIRNIRQISSSHHRISLISRRLRRTFFFVFASSPHPAQQLVTLLTHFHFCCCLFCSTRTCRRRTREKLFGCLDIKLCPRGGGLNVL